jgi:mannose-6-phosphate isomerase-like protein (cupin superfamily)
MRLIALGLLAAGFALPAGDPPGFYVWKSAELKAFSKSLAPKVNQAHVASQVLTNFGNYSFMMAHRDGAGEAEFHATQADVFFVQSGEGTLTYGGSLVSGKNTAPNEMRAPSISGGMDKKIAAGDVVTIPAKVAHQLKVDAGKEITYFVVKVTQN